MIGVRLGRLNIRWFAFRGWGQAVWYFLRSYAILSSMRSRISTIWCLSQSRPCVTTPTLSVPRLRNRYRYCHPPISESLRPDTGKMTVFPIIGLLLLPLSFPFLSFSSPARYGRSGRPDNNTPGGFLRFSFHSILRRRSGL